jgi:RNA-binding protein
MARQEAEGIKGSHDTLSPRSTASISMTSAPSASQKRHLRGLAHPLKPVILVGGKGVSDSVVAELELALERHELLKVKIAAGDRDERDAWIAQLVERSGATLVQRVGNIATLYRARSDQPGIVLPRA